MNMPNCVLFHPSEFTRSSWKLLLKKILPECKTTEASNVEEVRHAANLGLVSLLMMEFHPRDMDHGLEALKSVIALTGGKHLMLICGPPAPVTTRTAMQAGATVCLGCNESVEELKRALQAALEGVPYMSSELASVLARSITPSGGIHDEEDASQYALSIREEEVLDLLVSGLRPSQVANRLGLYENDLKPQTQCPWQTGCFKHSGSRADLDLKTHIPSSPKEFQRMLFARAL